MKFLFAVITVGRELVGILFLLISLSIDSAALRGALAATAVGFAVIPYSIARALQIMTDDSENLLRNAISEIQRLTLVTQQSNLSDLQRQTESTD